jgi:hypothetical protein
MDTTNESNDANSEIISNVDKENVKQKRWKIFQIKNLFFKDNLQIDEETRQFMSKWWFRKDD